MRYVQLETFNCIAELGVIRINYYSNDFQLRLFE